LADISVPERGGGLIVMVEFIEMGWWIDERIQQDLLSGFWLKGRAGHGLIFDIALELFDPFQHVRSL